MTAPLCKDCAHFIHHGAKCGRSQMAPDYVFGTKPQGNFDAQSERLWTLADSCGPSAKHFKPIPVAVAS